MPHVSHPATNFAMVPVRAFADKRFRTRHFRVLGALCKSYDKKTGCALVSQGKIAERATLSRGRVNQTLPDLEKWGYIRAVKRGRRPGGQFKTYGYVVLWEEPHVNHGGDTAHVDPVLDTTMLPPGSTDSYLSSSNLDSPSETFMGRAVARAAHPGGFAGSDINNCASETGKHGKVGEYASTDGADGNRRRVAHQGAPEAGNRRASPCQRSDTLALEKTARDFDADVELSKAWGTDVREVRELRALHDRVTNGWSLNRRVELDLKLRRETESMPQTEAIAYRRRRYDELLENVDAARPAN